MKRSYKVFILSLKLASLFTNSSSSESYIFSIPKKIPISKQGSFVIEIKENNLTSSQSLNIEFEDEFILKDKHGKPDIVGTIINPVITINPNETTNRTINYSLQNTSVGEYEGTLGFTISTKINYPSNMFMDTNTINSYLSDIAPNIITFSHDKIDNYDSVYDISAKQDESIMLYEVDGDAVISNNKSEKMLANESMSELFKDITYLKRIYNLDYIDFKDCLDISGMFEGCTNLQVINGLNNIDTSNCLDMNHLFSNCLDLTSLDVSNLDLTNTIDMSYMFENCRMASIDGLSSLDTSNIQNIAGTFKGCINLTDIPINNWNTTNVTNMSELFRMCSSITTLSLSNINTSNVKDLSYMFNGCEKLTSIGDISGWDTSSATNMSNMFKSCFALSTINLSNFNTKNVTDMSYMIYDTGLTSIGDISSWDVSSVETFSNFMVSNVKLNSFGDISKWKVTENCTNLSHMFENNSYNSRKTNFLYTRDLDLHEWRVDNVTDMSYMFCNTMNMPNINCTGWNVSKVKDMSYAFAQTNTKTTSKNTKIIGFDEWDVSSVENMDSMFYRSNMNDTSSFIKWNVSSVKNLDNAFYNCGYLDMNQFNAWDVTNVESWTNCFGGSPGYYIKDPVTGKYTVKDPPTWYH